MFGFYKSKGLNLSKQAFSACWITKQYLFAQAPKDTFFPLTDQKDKNLHDMMQGRLVGETNMICDTLAIKYETLIKEH